jgi:hypothetical protein
MLDSDLLTNEFAQNMKGDKPKFLNHLKKGVQEVV